MHEYQIILRNGLTLLCLIIISILFLKKSQSKKTNWAIFYASLWLSVSLAIVNYYCIKINLWSFNNNNKILKIPIDLYFIWIVFWAIIPVYFFKGKYILAIGLFLLWFDLVFMLELEKIGILNLNKNWLIGELFLLIFVWLPAYLWAKISYNQTHLKFRTLFQVLIMALFFIIILPQILFGYYPNQTNLSNFLIYFLQIGFIIVFPALTAVQDLVNIGKGYSISV